MTLLELLRSSFRLCGVLHEGQGPNADDINDSLTILNSMLEAWSLDRLNVFTIQPKTLTLKVLQQTYGIGPGATDFDTDRPLRIDVAKLITQGSSGPFELPLEVLTVEQWAAIPIKSTQSTLPQRVYLDNQYPIANLSVWPVPTAATSIVLYGWQAITTGFTDVSVDLSFPPGYADAIRYNLATRIAPEWGVSIKKEVVEFARETKANIKRFNKPRLFLGVEASDLNANGGLWNWLTGTTTRNA